MALPLVTHCLRKFAHTFQGLVCSEAKIRHTMAFEGYMVKGICSQGIFRRKAKFYFFHFRPLKKVWIDSPTAVSDRVNCSLSSFYIFFKCSSFPSFILIQTFLSLNPKYSSFLIHSLLVSIYFARTSLTLSS